MCYGNYDSHSAKYTNYLFFDLSLAACIAATSRSGVTGSSSIHTPVAS